MKDNDIVVVFFQEYLKTKHFSKQSVFIQNKNI